MVYCKAIFENFTESNHNISTDAENKFVSILQPLLAMIQHKLKGNYLYGEEYVIKFLQENRQNVTGEDVLDLSRHMSTCVAHLYIILIAMILSIVIGFPLACCLKICYRKVSNPKKHQYYFFSLCVAFALAMGFMLIGCFTSWNIGLQAQRYLERFPKEINTITYSWHTAKYEFRSNFERLHETIEINLDRISNVTANIYDDILGIIDEKTEEKYKLSIRKYENLTDRIKTIYRSFDFTYRPVLPTSGIETISEELNELIRKINEKFPADLAARKDLQASDNNKLFLDVAFPDDYAYPSLSEIYDHIVMILVDAIPSTNHTIYAVDQLKRNLKRIYDANMKKEIEKFQHLCNSTSFNMDKAINLLNATRIEILAQNVSLRLEKITSYSLFSNNKNISPYFKLTTWILLFPSLYGFMVFLFFGAGIAGTFRELQNVSNGKFDASSIYTTMLFKIAIRVSVTFLWLILLITSALYILHVPTMVLCGIVSKNKLLDRYLDRPYWQNETWIEFKLNHMFPQAVQRNSLTIRSFMTECRRNKTIIQSLKLEQCIATESIQKGIDDILQTLKLQFPETFQEQEFADVANLLMRLESVDYLMEMDFIPYMERDLRKMDNKIATLKEGFWNSAENQSLVKTIGEAKRRISEMRRSVKNFVQAKLLLTTTIEEMYELKEINRHLEYLTKHEVYTYVNRYLDGVMENIRCMDQELEVFTKQSLLYDFGKCSFVPEAYNKLKWMVCDHGLNLVNSFWLSLAILSFSIMIATILSCRIACYVRGSYKIQNQICLNERYSDRRSLVVNNNDLIEMMSGDGHRK